MSVQAITWALPQRCGGPGGKLVLFVLANYADAAGVCWPSTETIAAESELSVRSVLTWIQKLEELGLVDVERRKGSDGAQLTNKYRLRMLELPSMVAPSDGLDGRSLHKTIPEHPHANSALGEPEAGCNEQQSRVKSTAKPGATVACKPSIEPSTNHQDAREDVSHRDFLEAYPRRHDYSVAQVRTEWVALQHKGVDMAMVVEAAKGYALRCRASGQEERYMPRPENWLSRRLFEAAPKPKAPTSPDAGDAVAWFGLLPERIGGPVRLEATSDEFAAWVAWSRRERGRGIPASSGSWWFPCRWPPGHPDHVAPIKEAAA